MKSFRLAFLIATVSTVAATAQVIPGRYIVELTGNPLGAEVRTKGRAAMRGRAGQIQSEHARMRPMIEQHQGKVLASTDSLLNALIVAVPDSEAAAIAAMPGVKKVYPVYEYRADLDHALPIHNVPDAWNGILGGQANAGVGIKIGILDTGISPTHPGFQDAALKMPAGFPLGSTAANLALTTNKIIVARSYEDIYQEKVPDDAQDRLGHGTMVAMCAAGMTNKGPYGSITGVAPKAYIGGYKISPGNSGSASGDVILKAMDDALADGMDVINLSFGSPFQFQAAPDSIEAIAIDRLTRFGVVFVTSAGNSGPNLNTMGNFASTASAISVGAIQNSRFLAGSAAVGGGTPYMAFPGSSSSDNATLSAPMVDVFTVDPTSLACSPLAAGSVTGQIVLVSRGTCSFETKLNDAQAGGAVGVILYSAASSPGIFSAFAGAATLPLVTVGRVDGLAIKTAIAAAKSPLTATLVFNGISYPESYNITASFSSRGPNYDLSIKPDLSAVGTDVYMATQSLDPTGELYSKTGYLTAAGTSFSSPIVAGAVAVVRAYRPGLTVDQYRSLIINSASPFARQSDGWIERVQRTGAGLLNLDNALQSTAAAYPTSLTFGVGNGSLGGATTGDLNQLTLTNVGKTADTFTVSAIPYDGAPAVQFGTNPSGNDAASTLTVTMDSGKSKTVYVFWTTTNDLAPGEYQGLVSVQPGKTTTTAVVPYWYGVPPYVPFALSSLNGVRASAKVGTVLNVFVRVTDSIGYPITDNATLAFQGTAAAGGGSITLSNTLFFPNLRLIRLKLGPNPGPNTFLYSFGNLGPFGFTVTGTSGANALETPEATSIVRGVHGEPLVIQ